MAKKPRPRPRTPKRRVPPTLDSHVPPLQGVPQHPKGSLIIIGGNETKDGHKPILEEVASRVGRGKLVIATFASNEPREQWEQYRNVFRSIGVKRVEHLDARTRDELIATPQLEVVEGANVLFFAGGDQLKITSLFGGTPLCEAIRKRYSAGATIAGTSSGAAVMSETMLVAGNGGESHTSGESLRMAPGLGFIPGVIIDQHFAERGRIGRLLGAVAQNPRLLGIGIDEDTAVAFDGHRKFQVLGTGAVYVIDGRNVLYTDVAEDAGDTTSIHGLMLHVLATADSFDLVDRVPIAPPPKAKQRAQDQQRQQREKQHKEEQHKEEQQQEAAGQ
ncbi:MAG TPA: cyanophycinase [Vicinamibacterales bacterium]|nr:cyanophycinase [Vicinamibacterales bacterium]